MRKGKPISAICRVCKKPFESRNHNKKKLPKFCTPLCAQQGQGRGYRPRYLKAKPKFSKVFLDLCIVCFYPVVKRSKKRKAICGAGCRQVHEAWLKDKARKDALKGQKGAWKWGCSPIDLIPGERQRIRKDRRRKYKALWSHTERGKDQIANRNHRRRMQIKANYEPIKREEIYKRDNGICGICGVSMALLQVTLDHIKPLSLGGHHIKTNVRIAHMLCNSKRGTDYDHVIDYQRG